MKKTRRQSHSNSTNPDSVVSHAPRQPTVRYSVLACAAAVLGLAGGFGLGRCLPLSPPPGTAVSQQPTTAPDASQDGAAPAAAAESLPDPERLRPQTGEAVVREVEEAIDYLVAAFPNTPDALEMKARTQQWRGQSAEAVKTWERCLALDASYVHAFVGMAQVAAGKGEHDKAIELADKAIEIDSGNFLARATKADALIQLGRPADAIPVLADHLKIDARSRGFFLLGSAFLELKQPEQARDQLESAIASFPDYAEAYYLLSRTYRELGDEQRATEHLETYRKLTTPEQLSRREEEGEAAAGDLEHTCRGAATHFTDAGRMFMLNDRPAEAEIYWRRAARLDPQNVACRQSLAFLCRNANRLAETIGWFKELAEIEPKNISYWTEAGALFEELSAMPAAESALRKACEVAPDNPAGYAALADLLVRYERNPPEAVTLARTAVDQSPTPQNWALLSAAYLNNGENAAALTAIQEALRLAPQSASYRAVFDSIKRDL